MLKERPRLAIGRKQGSELPSGAIIIRILREAENDLVEGFGFYEEQEPGVGTHFLNTLASDLNSLRQCAGVHAVHFARYHRALSSRFPFAIYYTFSENVISVHAILDCRRDPAWIRERLAGRTPGAPD